MAAALEADEEMWWRDSQQQRAEFLGDRYAWFSAGRDGRGQLDRVSV
jgi:hypothetical protein